MNANANNNVAHEIPVVPSDFENNAHESKHQADDNRHDNSGSRNSDIREGGNGGYYEDHGLGQQGIDPYTNNPSHHDMFQSHPPNNMMYSANNSNQFPAAYDPAMSNASAFGYGPSASNNNNMAAFSYAPLHQQHQQQQLNGNNMGNYPQHPPHLSPNMPPTLPPPPPPLPIPNNTGLDAQRQYYEAQMREHALQYANAAAGAAYVAARIACGGDLGGLDVSSGQNAMGRLPSYYAPVSSSVGLIGQGDMQFNQHSHQNKQQPGHKRTLWQPPSSPAGSKNSSRGGGGSSKIEPKPKAQKVGAYNQQQEGKKRSKKRESGNDSISSLGSESRDLSIGKKPASGGGKPSGKKSSQRRRFNEDASTRERNASDDKRNNTVGNNTSNSARQKRALHHGHGSRSSFSSLGSNSGLGRNKKKNRSQQLETGGVNIGGSIFLGGLIGKNGVRALHELCSKYRWDMPRYFDSQSQEKKAEDVGRDANYDSVFVVTAHVNGVELGRGTAANKNLAKQDASRKALSALVPGVIFDPAGILMDVGSTTAEDVKKNVGMRALDELGGDLASQLAIGGANGLLGGGGSGVRSRPLSPDHSETSSISTAVSEDVTAGAALISGGPLLSYKVGLQHPQSPGGSLNAASGTAEGGRAVASSNMYPCASTASGVSSASDVDDEEYYASRGASVCSTLLYALWQIDARIREPPSYTFDLYPSVGNSAAPESASSAKRKKTESTSAPSPVSRKFQCAASVNLYFPKHLMDGGNDLSSIMDYWVSPLEYIQSKYCIPSSGEKVESSHSRKRKDSFASSQSTPSPNQLQEPADDDVDSDQETTPKRTKVSKQTKDVELIRHNLKGTGSGSTKRESKHKASAKLLAALFPGCNSMVEVKAEAEASRELYAANKVATTKRPKLSSPESRTGSSKRSAFAPPTKSGISLHALSLSESKEGAKRLKWSSSINDEVDAALISLQELDEESATDDVGKIILRQATEDDADHIRLLLAKSGTSASPQKKEAGVSESDSIENSTNNDEENEKEEDNQKKLELSDNSFLLVLSRAVALQDPPLGSAILTAKCSPNGKEKVLSLCQLGHEEHLPRERFIEKLEALAKAIHHTLETGALDNTLGVTLDEIKSFLSRSSYPSYQDEDVDNCVKDTSYRHSLHSVKEEEDEEDASDVCEKEGDHDEKIDIKADRGKAHKRSRLSV